MEPTRHGLRLSETLHLSYRVWGDGEPVVMLHGLADHGGVWQSLAAEIAPDYCGIAPDLRGHGQSSKPTSLAAYDARAIADDLVALVGDRGNTAVSVVAHSWAAKVALLWAQRQPQQVKSLVLVDPFFVNRLPTWLRPTFPMLYRTLPFLKVMGPFPSYAAAEAVARSLKQYRGWRPLQQAVFQEGMVQRSDGAWISQFAIAARNGVFEDIVQRAGLTADIVVPTLLLLPEKGLNRFGWQIQPYRRYLPQLQIQFIPGNHWPHLVQPEALNGAVKAFLSALR